MEEKNREVKERKKMTKNYSTMQEIKKEYSNRRFGLAIAQGVDAFGAIGGASASFGAGFGLEEPRYYILGTVILGAGIMGYNLIDRIKKNKNPRREQKELNKLEKQTNKNIPLIVENPEMVKRKYSKDVPLEVSKN